MARLLEECPRVNWEVNTVTDKTPLSPWPVHEQDEINAVTAVLESGKVNYWTGTNCTRFEAEFAKHCDSNHAIALANGTLALELALEAAGIGAGDDVIVTPRTFIASASCIVRLGGRPIFADVSPDSQNITPEAVASALTSNTKAIIAVHHAGWPCDMDGLLDLADRHGLIVIEDCAQAHGASYNGRPVGCLGHIAAFSFCQDKIMTTGGEGGMLVTNDEAIWKRAWAIKDHGKSYDSVFNEDHAPGFRWLHNSFGSNFRMTEMQAAIGRIQLTKLPQWHEIRNRNAARIIDTLCKYQSMRVPVPPSDIKHAYYRLYAFVETKYLKYDWNRDRIMNEINSAGVPCFSGSCPEIYNEKAFERDGLRPSMPLANANALGLVSLAFLVHPTLTSRDLDTVCATLDAVLSEATK
jgi:dTDP-4-amino-4,6-dideoxygalactose transaminase